MGAAVDNGRLLSASTLIGDPVRNRNQEDLGSIHELMIDTHDGNVAYAVVTYGGVLGMGNKLFAVPWGALEVCHEQKCLLLDANQATLEKAPGFDQENWPDMADPTWQKELHSFYGTQANSSCATARV